MQEEGLPEGDLVEEINKTRREINALGGMLTNIIAMQSTIIQDLKSGNIRTKNGEKLLRMMILFY